MKKNICFFIETPFSLGGVQRVSTVLANYLDNEKYSVSFLLFDKKKRVDKSFYNLNKNINIIFMDEYNNKMNRIIRKVLYKLKKIQSKYNIFRKSLKIQKRIFCTKRDAKIIAKYINKNNFDYVIGLAAENTARLCISKKYIKKTQIIGWQHSTFEAYFKTPNERFFNFDILAKYIFKNVDMYVCQTNDDFEKIKKEFNYTPIVINNPNTFSISKKSNLNSKNFIAVGRFINIKGFDKLIDAFKIFSRFNKDWKLYIIGDGEEKNNYTQKIKNYNLEDRIILPGKTDKIEEYYLNSSIYVMTSQWEGWGMVVTEAMSYGIPIISFDLPSIREIFSDKKCGLFVKKNSIEDLSKKMLYLTKNEKELMTFSKNSIEAVKRFDINIIGKKWTDILR